jgi:hypothetical protein
MNPRSILSLTVTPEFEIMCGGKYIQKDEEIVKLEDYVTAAPAAGKNF